MFFPSSGTVVPQEGKDFFVHAAPGCQAARNPEGSALEDSGCIAWFPWRL